MSDNEQWYPGAIICIVLILNMWFVTLLFHKLSYLDWTDVIITKKFWIWYLFWWCIIPYQLYKNRANNLESPELIV